MQGSGFRIQGLGFRVKGLGFRVAGLGVVNVQQQKDIAQRILGGCREGSLIVKGCGRLKRHRVAPRFREGFTFRLCGGFIESVERVSSVGSRV